MPLDMASFSFNELYDTAWATQRNSFYQGDDAVRGHSGVIQLSPGEISGHRSGSSSNTSLKRKPSRNSFLAWVAFDRKYALNISESQRRTCPLIGCEQDFKDPESMLKHVYECLPLSKGLYRCFECRNEERIGKYHNNGCKVLHQSKGSFAKVANSLRLAKRLFSRQALKCRPQAPQPLEVPDLGVHDSVLETAYFPAELETNWFDSPAELSEDGCLAELGIFDDSMYLSADQIFQRGTLSELDDNGTITTSASYVRPQHDATELEASSDPAFTVSSDNPARRQESNWRRSRQHIDSKEYKWHGHTPSESHSLNLTTQDKFQARHQTPQSLFSPEPYRGTTADDLISPISPTDDNYRYPNTPALSPAVRSPGQDTSSDPWVSPTAPNTSTRDNSISSSDSSIPSLEEYRLSTTPFLGGLGQDMMYSEPEDMGTLPMTENDDENLTFSDPYPWYTSPDGFAFGDNTLISIPQPLIIMKQQARQDMNHFQLGISSPPLPSPGNSPQPTLAPWSPGPKHRCICGFEPSGKEENKNSNLKRHQKKCWQCAGTASHDPFIYICNYRRCGLRYNRSDNLLAHQRIKKHSRDFELHLIPVSSPLSESYGPAFELDSREVQPKRRRKD